MRRKVRHYHKRQVGNNFGKSRYSYGETKEAKKISDWISFNWSKFEPVTSKYKLSVLPLHQF